MFTLFRDRYQLNRAGVIFIFGHHGQDKEHAMGVEGRRVLAKAKYIPLPTADILITGVSVNGHGI